MLHIDVVGRADAIELFLHDALDGNRLPCRRLQPRKIEQVADDFLGETDLRAQNAEVVLHVRRRVLENHAEIVERVGHDAERISELVADAAGELAEHGELLAPDQRFLR